MKLLCYGDSNTWGYDPRDPLGGPYAGGSWCRVLQQLTQASVRNLGENGRTVPRQEAQYRILENALRADAPELLFILLGTNDLLTGAGTPEEIADALFRLVDRIRRDFPSVRTVLLPPPPIRLPGYAESCRKLRRLCLELPGECFDPGELPLSFDGVHLTWEGHRQLGERIRAYLTEHP